MRYKVTMTVASEVGEFTIYDDSLNIEGLFLIDPVVTYGLNKTGSFTFTVPNNHPCFNNIYKVNSILCVKMIWDDNTQSKLMHFRSLTSEEDFNKTRKVECEGILSFLFDSIVRPYSFSGTPEAYINQLISQHNTQVESNKQFTDNYVNVVDTDSNNYIVRGNIDYPTTFNEFKDKVLDPLGAYITATAYNNHYKLNVYQQDELYTNTTQKVQFGENIIDLVTKSSFEELRTVIIPLGAKDNSGNRITLLHALSTYQPSDWSTKFKDYCTKSGNTYTHLTGSTAPTWTDDTYYYGYDYVYDSDAIAEHGYIVGKVEFDDVTTWAALKRKAELYLQDTINPIKSITVNVIDLSCVDEELDYLGLDNVTVVSIPHGINEQMLITDRVIHLNDPTKDKITLGKVKRTMTSSQAHANADVTKKVSQIKDDYTSYIENATNLITGANGGYIKFTHDSSGKPTEMLIMDNEDSAQAINVIRFNQNGIGFSTTGINGTYANAWTIDGNLVADFISSGVLESVLIRSNGAQYTSSTTDGVTTYHVTDGMIIDLAQKCFATPYFNISSNGNTEYKGLLRYKNATTGTQEETMRWEYTDFENNNHGSMYSQFYNANQIPGHPVPIYLLRLILEAPRLLLKTYDEEYDEQYYFELLGRGGGSLQTNIKYIRALGQYGFNVSEDIRTQSHLFCGWGQVAPIHFAKISKSVTVPANSIVCEVFGYLSSYDPSNSDIEVQSYTYMGCMVETGGYGDQWLVSPSKYGDLLTAMIESKYPESLTSTITITTVWCATNLSGNPGTDYIPCFTSYDI